MRTSSTAYNQRFAFNKYIEIGNSEGGVIQFISLNSLIMVRTYITLVSV